MLHSKFVSVKAAVSLALLSFLAAPAMALVKLDSKTIDSALTYGMQNQKMGLSSLLGPNWVEGENGSLLNVYSPFMMLAAKAAKGGYPSNPGKADLKKARERYGRDVAYYGDSKNRIQVKFAVSLYGNSPDFAKNYYARIIGFGRGKEFEITPAKQFLDQKADQISGSQGAGSYEAINSYYFLYSDLADLQEFRLELQSANGGEPIVFRLNNEKLY